MEVLFCGTAAAEGWPAVFCTCEPCRKAHELGGRNLRTRSAYMIGDRVRIDFGPDSLHHQMRYGLAYDRLEHLLVSHSHDDHWHPVDVTYRRPGFSIVPVEDRLHIWGNARVRQRFVDIAGDDWARYRLQFHEVELWRPCDLGQGLTATPLAAAHDQGEQCVTYLLADGGRLALFANDTGWYPDETWEFLNGRALSMAAIDCTYGREDSSRGHMGAPWVVRARDELAKRGALAPDARVIATHFSHNGGWLHEELERFFAPHGIEVAWDGLRVTV